jgi:hypothetical protein
MIERKDGETDASWIGRLEAAYKALLFSCESLEKKLKQAHEERAQFAFETGKLHGGLIMDVQKAQDLLRLIRYDPGLSKAFLEQIDSLLT